jgi:zinc finger SWIM domain-containing protein 3
MAKQAGGIENLGCTREDMKNRLYSKRTIQTKEGDTRGVLEYMEKKVSEDVNFFYSIQVDEDDLITNIFGLTPKWSQTMRCLVMLYALTPHIGN